MRKSFFTAEFSSPGVPRPGEGRRGEAGHIGYLLRQAGAVHRLRMERALADLAVTPPQFSALTMIKAYPGISNADLARLSLLTPQTVNVIVANLEKQGAIVRRPHPVHGRIRRLEITGAGGKLLTRCRAKVDEVEKWLLEGLSGPGEQTVKRWLAGLAARQSMERDQTV